MSYGTYNRAMYRTGFRPYGATSTWAASQLNGVPPGLGQNHPFTPDGGWRLHGLEGSASFHPWVLRGMGMSVCLGPDENTVACADPSCTYGDCGSTEQQQVGGPLCLDQKENSIPCANPNCTYGDCTGPRAVAPAPGPAPRVNVPTSQFPATAPKTAQPAPQWMASSIISGIPDLFIYGGAFLLAASVLMPQGGRRR